MQNILIKFRENKVFEIDLQVQMLKETSFKVIEITLNENWKHFLGVFIAMSAGPYDRVIF